MSQIDSQLTEVIEILKQGGVVVIPTETAYGLAADATNSRAAKRIFAIKGRDINKTPPLIVASMEMAKRYFVFTPKLEELARQFWPGPLTLIGKAKPSLLSPSVLREDGTIAIRVSSHPVPRAISEALDAPIVATSANDSGKPECFSVEDIKEQLIFKPLQPDLYFDGGVLEPKLSSTIIKEENGTLIVLRKGIIDISPYVT